jgi:hypothetical protein
VKIVNSYYIEKRANIKQRIQDGFITAVKFILSFGWERKLVIGDW